MAKTTGLGDNFYAAGYDLSGDANSLGRIGGGPQLLDYTPINKFAFVRLGSTRSAQMQFVTFFDPNAGVAGPAPLPTQAVTDTVCTYARGTTLGAPAACMNAKQINFDPTRANNGMLTVAVNMESNAYGLEWGEQLTAGLRTDTVATAGATVDDGAGTAFGAQAYLQVTAFSGTSVDIFIEHSTNGTVWTTLMDFGAQSAIGASRISVANTTTVNRFVRASTGTGTFSSVTFNVTFVRNPIAGVVF